MMRESRIQRNSKDGNIKEDFTSNIFPPAFI